MAADILEDCEIMTDEWPFLEPIIEIKGPSEKSVMNAVKILEYSPSDCRICATGALYEEKYGVKEDIISNHTPLILFDMDNPFMRES